MGAFGRVEAPLLDRTGRPLAAASEAAVAALGLSTRWTTLAQRASTAATAVLELLSRKPGMLLWALVAAAAVGAGAFFGLGTLVERLLPAWLTKPNDGRDVRKLAAQGRERGVAE